MNKENICPFCQHSIPQKTCGLGLVDCLCKGYGNAHQTECESFCENSRLANLRDAAIETIREFDKAREGSNGTAEAKLKAMASRSIALQEAFAIMLDISQNDASVMLWEWAKKQVN